ncbi:methyltransferase domain-containing protein [Sphingomonas koreensis]|uniref:Methyltransferase domain-containing protein n=1 Tax=Sphingomonas koreensis TaxID=93064 RepID=A0A2M8W9X1_9SPHN|nr:methyltransferase domain-containing protein [Sphingomonas koreensis]PJI87733.1 putative methyltransferase [Sphingomonas koreensis]RSU58249.1 methyltransferase domain-containing protein [Sphingomonas koreensis]RSU71797.1 methyltransferase domain-containing protein [Sphingomonas koreensis]RSY77555.1 methyltransferase domain-containing protein [Sphingomonas koreensis]
MRNALSFAAITATALVSAAAIGAPQMGSVSKELKAAVAAPTRTPANTVRDKYRHPAETLAFFGVKPTDTVVELWPGGGWYTEILAPYVLNGGGVYYAASLEKLSGGTKRMMTAKPELYGKIRTAHFPVFDAADVKVPDNSVDVVLTFRNVHNWRMGYQRDDKQDYAAAAFKQIFAMLKPGGTLGIVDHRLPEGADAERERTSGYIKTSTIKTLAAAAGFRLAGESQVNANPKDTADWEKGVWTLPPSYALKDIDRAKYEAIGESDRMTLKFVKPGK